MRELSFKFLSWEDGWVDGDGIPCDGEHSCGEIIRDIRHKASKNVF